MSQLLQAGLNITAIGMGVVFVLLSLLVGIVRGMSALSRAIERAVPGVSRGVATQPVSVSLPEHELVGVISAALAAHRRKR